MENEKIIITQNHVKDPVTRLNFAYSVADKIAEIYESEKPSLQSGLYLIFEAHKNETDEAFITAEDLFDVLGVMITRLTLWHQHRIAIEPKFTVNSETHRTYKMYVSVIGSSAYIC